MTRLGAPPPALVFELARPPFLDDVDVDSALDAIALVYDANLKQNCELKIESCQQFKRTHEKSYTFLALLGN